jgi:hypothetical protein
MLTEQKVQDIQAQLISSHKFLRHLAQETGTLLVSAFTATRLIKFQLYKIMVVPELMLGHIM